MGKALQVISGRVTNPGATITALTPDTGDTFTVRSAPMESKIYLDEAWSQNSTGGVLRVRSPRLHDQAQGIRLRVAAASPQPLLPFELRQPLYSQDPLTIEMSGGGAEVDAASLLVYYDDLPGIAARLYTWEQIAPLIENIVGVEVNFTSGGTAGDYGGSKALNANFDQLIRGNDYALLGFLTDTACCTIGLSGPDTGNLRVGGPGSTRADLTEDWFVELSQRLGLPYIPVINAANVAGTTVDVVSQNTGATINVTYLLAELSHSLS